MERELTFTDPAGHHVAATLATPTRKTTRVAVLCHGFLSNRHSSTNRALTAALVPQGIATFRFDCFGHGDSAGSLEHLTIGLAVDQALAALELVLSLGYRRVGLVGSSFGGMVATLAAARWNQGPDRLASLALKCPVADFPAMLQGEFGEAGMAQWQATDSIPDVRGGNGRLQFPYRFYEDCRLHVCYGPAQNLRVPTLIVHGDADEYVPVAQSRRLAASLGGRSLLVVLPGADHHFSSPPHFEEMITLIARWLLDHLGGRKSSAPTL